MGSSIRSKRKNYSSIGWGIRNNNIIRVIFFGMQKPINKFFFIEELFI